MFVCFGQFERLGLIFFIILSLSACGDSPKTAAQTSTLKVGTPHAANQVSNPAASFAGGVPGEIILRGGIVEPPIDPAKPATFDTLHISTHQEGGRGSHSTKSAEHVTLIHDFDTSQLAQARASKKYLNLNCPPPNANDTAGLDLLTDESTDTSVFYYEVKKIFVCGNFQATQPSIHLVAAEVILNGAQITSSPTPKSPGSILILADQVSMVGNNVIQTVGPDSDSNVVTAGSIDLGVSGKVKGLGAHLLLQSRGGNSTHKEPVKPIGHPVSRPPVKPKPPVNPTAPKPNPVVPPPPPHL